VTIQTVLVTGATGCLGSHLVYDLLNKGLAVKALGRDVERGQALQTLGADFYAVELWDLATLKTLCHNVDMVVHCGGLTTMWDRKAQFYQVNTLGTRNVVAACLQAKVKRFIHLSSASVYFNGSDRLNIEETDPLPKRFINTYAWSKYLADQHVQYGIAQGLPTIVLRPMGIIGSGDTPLLKALIQANTKTGLPLISQGQALVDMTCVDNATDAIWLAMTATPAACGQIYHISNDEPQAVNTFLPALFQAIQQPLHWEPKPYKWAFAQTVAQEWLGKISQNPPLLTRYHIEWLAHSHTLQLNKARNLLGYTPQKTTEQGIAEFATYWLTTNRVTI
jgi:2-alkyl-3-oxoalkanoate reductase